MIFKKENVNGSEIELCCNLANDFAATEYTAEGTVLKAEKLMGKGKLILINAKAYPHHPAINDIYVNTVKETNSHLIANENAWIECGNDIEFTVYDREDGKRDIYVLAVDWYNDPHTNRSFTLRLGSHKYSLKIPFGTMLKIVIKGNIAAFVYNEDAETDFGEDNTVTVQGSGDMTLKIAQDGTITDIPMHFGNAHKLNISI